MLLCIIDQIWTWRGILSHKNQDSTKREPCAYCGKLFKTSILQIRQRNHTKSSNFQHIVQPSTLVLTQKSFESWLNIGWNPAWGGYLFSKILALWYKLMYINRRVQYGWTGSLAMSLWQSWISGGPGRPLGVLELPRGRVSQGNITGKYHREITGKYLQVISSTLFGILASFRLKSSVGGCPYHTVPIPIPWRPLDLSKLNVWEQLKILAFVTWRHLYTDPIPYSGCGPH